MLHNDCNIIMGFMFLESDETRIFVDQDVAGGRVDPLSLSGGDCRQLSVAVSQLLSFEYGSQKCDPKGSQIEGMEIF